MKMVKISSELDNVVAIVNNDKVPYQASYQNQSGSYNIIPYFKTTDVAQEFVDSFEIKEALIIRTTMSSLQKSIKGTKLVLALIELADGTFSIDMQIESFGSEYIN